MRYRDVFLLGDKFTPKFSLGGKAGSLHQLSLCGINVPAGFVVSDTLDLNNSRYLLSEMLSKIGGFPVAVRSSANLEDTEMASFAGQYSTVLNVNSLDDLIEAVQCSRDSKNSEAVAKYAEGIGLSMDTVKVSVLIQKMVVPKFAGVLFTVDPVNGHDQAMLVEYCEGLGEDLVSGKIAPSRLAIDIWSGNAKWFNKNSETKKLTLIECEKLVMQGLKVQAEYKKPQDIEWAMDESGLVHILQSRPITQMSYRTDTEEYTNADFRDGGVSAQVCTPFMYSLYREVMTDSMNQYFKKIKLRNRWSKPENWISIFYGRPFWNASAVKRTLLKVPGFDEKDFDQDLGINKDYGKEGPKRISFSFFNVVRILPTLLAMNWQFRKTIKKTKKFHRDFLSKEKGLHESFVQKRTDTEFEIFYAKFLRENYFLTEKCYFETIYNNSNVQSEFKSFLRGLENKFRLKIDPKDLMVGLNQVSHIELQYDICHLFETAKKSGINSEDFRSAVEDFIVINYFHGPSELDLRVPRWSEEPGLIYEMISSMMKSGLTPTNPTATLLRQKQLYKKHLRRISLILKKNWYKGPFLYFRFLNQVRRAREFLVRREQIRECSTKTYFFVRQGLLDLGKRWFSNGLIENIDDLFFMDINELLEVLESRDFNAINKSLIKRRRLYYIGYSEFQPPNELGGKIVQDLEPATSDQEGRFLGTGCSPGFVEAPVRVIHSVKDVGEVLPGEILVTRFTDPGWTPVLGVVKGVITEVGGVLSHAAVISREYGIPAVLNLSGATQILKTGQRVRVDGSSGTVELIESNS